ncbi:MAG: cyclase family protein [Candidatus Aminicenantes bacterium]|nr:cyclase family protein [Candidatus Aminicenantes bacterium]
MNVVDLSHPLGEAMPVYPGTEPPRITDACTIAGNGFAEKLLRLYSHTGTHVDAPGHILPGAATLDRFEAGRFIGPGCLLDVSRARGLRVEIADLEKDAERIAVAEFAIFYSGWAKRWGDASYFYGYPALSETAAHWLAGFNLKGVGVDMISVDEMNSTSMDIHKILLSKDMVIIENLAGLEPLIGREFVFSCLPLNIISGDGSPVRAVAMIGEE